MGSTLKSKLNQLSPARRAKIAKRSEQLIDEEMTLQDLRHALALTQKEVSEKLHIQQDGVSRLERRTDLLLSTLRHYIHSLGGELTLSAEFPNRPPIKLTGFGDLESKNR